MLTRISKGFVLRKYGNRFDAADRMALVARRFDSPSAGSGLSLFAVVGLVLVIAALVALVAHPIVFTSVALSKTIGLGFAGTLVKQTEPSNGGKKPVKIREMEAQLKALAKELEVGQLEMSSGEISQNRGEELEEKAKEMEEIQGHLDRYNRIADTLGASRKLKEVTLPSSDDIERKKFYTTPGHKFVLSDEFQKYRAQGRVPGLWSSPIDSGKALGQKVLLTGQAAVAFEKKAFDSATLGVYGADSIIPYDRDPELVRYQEPEILTIRQFLNQMPTTSDAVKYVRYTTTARAAGTQVNRGDLKGFLKLNTELDTVNVETIAVLSKVTEQDIDDAPRLVGLINGEMTLDTKVQEEQQIVWGNGSGALSGIFDPANGVPEFNRADPGDSVIDTIRKMRTDLRKRRVFPNFVAIDPVDWESVELAKGTTNYYIWGLVSDMRGPRIWSLPAVESDAMTNNANQERRILIGDGPRGATIYDRQGIQLAVGFMDDDFGRNLRTLRCEERLALAIKRPFAFEFVTTDPPLS